MPALQRIIPSRGKEFWDALDPDNMKQVLEAVKEEVKLYVRLAIQDLISAQNQFKRPEPAYELHYLSTMSRGLPIGDNKPCYRDCLIFLLRGEFIIKGQGRVIETGCAYRVKDEAWCQRRCNRIVQGSICGLKNELVLLTMRRCQLSIYICSRHLSAALPACKRRLNLAVL
jgi:hypothetical protein